LQNAGEDRFARTRERSRAPERGRAEHHEAEHRQVGTGASSAMGSCSLSAEKGVLSLRASRRNTSERSHWVAPLDTLTFFTEVCKR